MGFEDLPSQLTPTSETSGSEQILTPENVEKIYAKVIQLLDEYWKKKVEEDRSRSGVLAPLETHNKIVTGYAAKISEILGLQGQDRAVAMIGTIFHDSAKLDSQPLEHHIEGAQVAAELSEKLVGETIDGVTITKEMIGPISDAVRRHQNHPFLIGNNGGKRFEEPEKKTDLVVFLSDMMANVGFKNIAFRLFPNKGTQFTHQDVSMAMESRFAKENPDKVSDDKKDKLKDRAEDHLVQALNDVFNDQTGVAHLVDNVFYEVKDGKKVRRDSMAGTEDVERFMTETIDKAAIIYERLKEELPKLEAQVTHKNSRSGAESYGHRIWELSAEPGDGEGWPAGVKFMKREINKVIERIGTEEGLDPDIVNNFKM
jgi:hypothetical protein